jgi:hypothetical protein
VRAVRRASWLAGVCAVVVVAGCGSHERADPQPGHGVGTNDCAASTDALIDAGKVPRSDREYVIGMCEGQR